MRNRLLLVGVFATPKEAVQPSGENAEERGEELQFTQVCSENRHHMVVKSCNRGKGTKCTLLELPTGDPLRELVHFWFLVRLWDTVSRRVLPSQKNV